MSTSFSGLGDLEESDRGFGPGDRPRDPSLDRGIDQAVRRGDPGDADAQGAKLKGLAGFGPTIRVRPVGMAWSELAKLMREAGAATVAELDHDVVVGYAERLRVVHPSGSLMQDPEESQGGT